MPGFNPPVCNTRCLTSRNKRCRCACKGLYHGIAQGQGPEALDAVKTRVKRHTDILEEVAASNADTHQLELFPKPVPDELPGTPQSPQEEKSQPQDAGREIRRFLDQFPPAEQVPMP